MQIDSLDLNWTIGQRIFISYKLENMNYYPAKIIADRSFSTIRDNPPDLQVLRDQMERPKQSMYITHDRAVSIHHFDRRIVNSKIDAAWKDNKVFFYFGSIVLYENLVTKKKKLYYFLTKIFSDHSMQYMINDNVDFEKERKKHRFPKFKNINY